MWIALVIGVIALWIFLWVILTLKVRVITFTAPSLKELQKQINIFTESHFFKKIRDITIRDEEGQYYGYVRWVGFGSSEE